MSDAGASINGRASDHLANERTFLAWIRTSISVIVFGFVVAKFGVTLREFLQTQNRGQSESRLSLMIGVAFMSMGIFMALVSLVRYRSTMKQLTAGRFEPADTVVTLLGVVTAFFGAILAGYLIFTARYL
jgi:putative membrane protein